ncbi:MAG: amidase [Spirochaetaceae bacterium]|nr:amidase [Spirochaetaceae bacterium]
MVLGDVDLCLRPATELAALVRSRELSAADLLAAHLEQIERINPRVNAICTLDAEGATAAATRLDEELAAGEEPGPLAGLPVVVKDLVDVAGMPTTRGSPLYRDAVAEYDDLMVARMRAAGAVIVGKSNVPEFGAGSHTFNTVFGVTRNPYDLGRSAGGSSGGGAAALTSGMVAVADGSDYGGSIRNPPNFNSVVGLRPTPGRVPRIPAGDPWETLSVTGPMGRTVADAALLLSVIAGPDRRDPTSICEPGAPFADVAARNLKGCRVAWSRDLGMLPVEPAVAEAIERALPLLTDLGCRVEEAHPDLSGGAEAFDTIRALRFAADHAATLRDHRGQLKDTVIWNIERGLALTTGQVIRAQQLRAEQFLRMSAFLERFDVLILPVSQVLPFPVEVDWPRSVAGVPMATYIDWMQSCSLITMTSHPALSLPCGFTPEGLPVGAQIVGRYGGEAGLLSFAAAWEDALAISSRRPALAHADTSD